MTGSSPNNETPVFITGATGFFGSYLVRHLLEQGYTRIRALRRAGSSDCLLGDAAHSLEWVEGDLLDQFALEDALDGIRQVYHCAGIAPFTPHDTHTMMTVNVEGTANLINAALYQQVEKLLHVSSTATLGRIRNGSTLDESSKWQRSRFNTSFALSKFKAEQEAWRGVAEGLNVAIINPALMLGSGKWDSGPCQFFKLAHKGFPFFPQGATGFVDVRDAARFAHQFMESDASAQRYILCAENRTYHWLLTQISSALGQPPPKYPANLLLRSAGWRLAKLKALFNGKSPILTRETAQLTAWRFSFDGGRATEDFDFQYLPINQTITETGQQFLEASQHGKECTFLPLEG